MACDFDGKRTFSTTSSNYEQLLNEEILTISIISQFRLSTSMRSASPIPLRIPKISKRKFPFRTFSNDSRVSDVTFQEDTEHVLSSNDEPEYLNDGKDQIEAKLYLLPIGMNATREAEIHSTLLQTDTLSKSSIAVYDAHRIESSLNNVEMTVSKKATTEEGSTKISVMNADIQKYDVLSGRGGKSNNHQGNKFYRKLIELKKQEYKSKMTNCEKQAVSESILKEIQCKGGRFLTQQKTKSEPGWFVMSSDKAKSKISQALREERNLKWTDHVSGSFDEDDSV